MVKPVPQEPPAGTSAINHWQIIGERLLADRSPYAKLYDQDLRLPDGEVLTNFLRVELPPFVIIFAVMDNGQVPFVRQYRQAVRAYTLELPAGHMDNGEDPLVAAQRELREETGFEATDWRFLGKYIMDANRHCGYAHAYLARGARRAAAPEAGDLGEMTVQFLPLDEVRRVWSSGEMIVAPTALCTGLALNVLAGS